MQIYGENLSNIGKLDPRLGRAVAGSGKPNPNISIGNGTAAESDALGRAWVGDGARLLSDGKGLASADGTLTYRFPILKPARNGYPASVMSNFERVVVNPVTGVKTIIVNGHLTIVP